MCCGISILKNKNETGFSRLKKIPVGIYMFKVNKETLEQGVKYVQR